MNKNRKKRVLISVINDLVSDQRVHKTALVYKDAGYEVKLIGRQFKNSEPLNREYKSFRFRLCFNNKVWFYAEYNLKLFFYLLFQKLDVLHSNDLDTLLPNFLVSKIRRKPLIYDSHEYFTEVPELIARPLIRAVWLNIERFLFPKLKYVYTVNQSIADIYTRKYGVKVGVLRNMPFRLKNREIDESLKKTIKQGKRMLIMQGAGINVDRGAEELIQAMPMVENAILYIIGSGDVFPQLKQLVKDNHLSNQVFIVDRMPYEDLMEYTKIADIGLSLDKGTNPNYENSLPNKVFDYVQAGIPLLVSNRKVVAALVRDNAIGQICDSHQPHRLAQAINQMLNDTKALEQYRKQTLTLRDTLVWEHESQTLRKILQTISE